MCHCVEDKIKSLHAESVNHVLKFLCKHFIERLYNLEVIISYRICRTMEKEIRDLTTVGKTIFIPTNVQ